MRNEIKEGLEQHAGNMKEKAGEYASKARDKAGEYAGKASEYASSMKEKAGEYASTAREKAGEYASVARERAGEYAASAGQSLRTADRAIERTAASLPANAFVAGALGSIGISLALKLMGRHKDADFVGHWVPTLLALALFTKLTEHASHDHGDQGAWSDEND